VVSCVATIIHLHEHMTSCPLVTRENRFSSSRKKEKIYELRFDMADIQDLCTPSGFALRKAKYIVVFACFVEFYVVCFMLFHM